MLKLVSLNMESDKHLSRVVDFLQQEKPTVICLQEAPNTFLPTLESFGYQTSFAPMCHKGPFTMGVAIATKQKFTARAHYYHRAHLDIIEYEATNKAGSISHPYLIAELDFEDKLYRVATTHVMVTKDGLTDDHQRTGVASMLTALAEEEPHFLCGDLNIPRGYNELYADLTTLYADAIPKSYKSSLDPVWHTLARKEVTDNPLDRYLVDYLLTQTPYRASSVRLQFGLSDHAGIVAQIDRDAPSVGS